MLLRATCLLLATPSSWKSRPASRTPPPAAASSPAAPRHVALIPDGNARWAAREGRPASDGHWAGVAALRAVVEACATHPAIETLTVYAFSAENWQRPERETRWIFELVRQVVVDEGERLREGGVSLRFIGEHERLPLELRETLSSCAKLGPIKGEQRLLLCVALSYGGRQEIARVARQLAVQVAAGELRPSDIDEAGFGEALSSSPYSTPSDPDLLVRTGGQQRLSNFLLFQVAYTELYVTDVLWPDFTVVNFEQALHDYAHRKRTFGKRIP
ncbi:hypothetical protein AB1Y20_005518 [Prymnesium parvum]|uniref:Alkyl transferase n=1 Tax=Prymnesium parvum TaxID=97485 RepID=A0AB34J6S7_PRYPA